MKVLLIGNQGQLGSSFYSLLKQLNYDVSVYPGMLSQFAKRAPHPTNFDVVINTVAYNDIDNSRRDAAQAFETNCFYVERIAGMCEYDTKFVTYSTDCVLDAQGQENPLSIYGLSKLCGEQRALTANRDSLIIRTSCVFTDTTGFPAKVLAQVNEGKTVTLPSNLYGHPTHALWLASRTLDELHKGTSGVITIQGSTELSRYRWALEFVPSDKHHLLKAEHNTTDMLRAYRR